MFSVSSLFLIWPESLKFGGDCVSHACDHYLQAAGTGLDVVLVAGTLCDLVLVKQRLIHGDTSKFRLRNTS